MEEAGSRMEGVKLKCLKCVKCGEELYSASEMLRYEVLTGKRKPVRKITMLGSSMAVRLPKKLVEEVDIHEGDLAYFEKHPEGVLIKVVHAEE